MNVVGRVGSLITQGVYSVATPFHPFGGAVDIIVVEQEDGTYRSTPWYVRFGKFQGIIKGAEKIVSIAVNGVEADFHMYLDHSGQAYFMREVKSGSIDAETSDQNFDKINVQESRQCDNIGNTADDCQGVYDEQREEVENDEQSYGFRDEQISPELSSHSPGFSTYSYCNLEEVEDLVKSPNASNSEMVLVSVDGHVLTAPISMNEENVDNLQSSNPQFHLGPGGGSAKDFGDRGDMWEDGLFGDLITSAVSKDASTSEHQLEAPKDDKGDSVYVEDAHNIGNGDLSSSTEDINAGISKDDMFKSCLDLASQIQDGVSLDTGSSSLELDPNYNAECSREIYSVSEITMEETATRANCNLRTDALQPVRIRVKDDSVDFRPEDGQVGMNVTPFNSDLPCCDRSPTKNNVIDTPENVSISENTVHEDPVNAVSNVEEMCSIPERSATEGECSQTEDSGLEGSISGLGFEISLCGNLLRPHMGCGSAEAAFEAHRISVEDFKSSGPSIIKNGNLIIRFQGRYFPWDKAAYIVLGKVAFGSNFSSESNGSIPVEHEEQAKNREDAYGISPSSSRRWRLWSIPFRRAKSLQHSNSNSSSEELFVDSESGLQSPKAEHIPNANNDNQSPCKQFMRTYIPTTEQIASLNLKDGQNVIAFSFSTRVLGKQEVDAHIYLWKWNARIVISDVDGTITKSDVLGQVMPLVGKDWTQSGVAGLFSAIKENGYQLLFLSARAIVQAYLTRSFLLNLKQDGKALPNGPIVISPDGLFPSLYREVIRRAPHEFKIACLEDIRALFPSDYNPFYAGFGNRDTDELSYRKIGIPKGKIFIINPKGEVAINHCNDVRSYTSLHTLVNDMFPPTSLSEQEDFNSWNYWKMPLPDIDS